MQPAEYSLEKPLYYTDVSFVYSSILNWEDFAYLINKIVQNNKIVIQSDDAI